MMVNIQHSHFRVARRDAALAQNATAGEAAFTNCQACHDIGDGASNKLGSGVFR
jgi:cytochrome c2